MKVVVVGGKLQGVEVAYLARKAGWKVILIDKEAAVPAAGLCEEFYQLDVIVNYDQIISIVKNADMILPALENQIVLQRLEQLAKITGVPIALDLISYNISSSKIKSDNLFMENGIAAPVYWPNANFPVIAKPSGASGSKGVIKISNYNELEEFFSQPSINSNIWVVQEYLEGPSYSLEVLGNKGQFITFQVTELEMDKDYDCKRVLAPVNLDPVIEKQFRDLSVQIAEKVNLTGIMDVEVINAEGTLKVLEIDARLPSQTPTVVYKSTGINILTQLYEVFVHGNVPILKQIANPKIVIYEHVKVSEEGIETLGEHIMATAGPLTYFENFWGADEALTNYKPGSKCWVATLIFTGISSTEVWEKRSKVIRDIKTHMA